MKDTKTTTLLLKLDADLKKSFQASTKAHDRSMSNVLRDFMRDYVKKHGQGDLFKQMK